LRKSPRLSEKYPSQPHTYLRNIQKGKKEKKSWYWYIFLEVTRGELAHSEEERTED